MKFFFTNIHWARRSHYNFKIFNTWLRLFKIPQETTNPVTMENSKTEQESSTIQQAMLQAGVIQSFETNQATEVSNDSAAEPMTPKVSRVNEGAHQEGNLKGKYGQECTENIQNLIQEVLNQEQVVSRTQPHTIKEQTPSVTAQSSHSVP